MTQKGVQKCSGSSRSGRPAAGPELAAPAGDWASLSAAVEGGADAVYFGVRGINMRHQAANFQVNELPKVMRFLKEAGKKGYLALNTVMMPSNLGLARKSVEAARAAAVDAVILWDLAVLKMAKDAGLRVHLSTQAGAANAEAVKYYVKLGVKQVVLARECTLKDIQKIIRQLNRDNVKCRIETFVHGAMCVSVSGRCFLSQETFGKSANQGKCLQPCRREFRIQDAEGESAYILGQDYVLSPKDLCAIDFVDQLIQAGIGSFKIEGRMRSPEYVRVVTSCYRQAIDAHLQKQLTDDMKTALRARLASVYNRGFSSGFFFGQPDRDSWSRGLEHTHEKVFIGDVARFFKKISVAEVRLRSGGIREGDGLLFIGKTTPGLMCGAGQMQRDGGFVTASVKGEVIGVKVPFAVRPGDKVFLWRKRRGEDLTAEARVGGPLEESEL